MRKNNSRELLFFEEKSLSLKAIIAIDSIVLGPANGSAKLYLYENEDEAISDALDIAYHNSLRASLLRRCLGGGSIVLWGDAKKVKSEMYFRALGVFLNRWNGKLYLTKSKGVTYKDLNYVRRESKFILGLEETYNGLGSIYVSRAKGIIWALKAATKHKLKTGSLKGLNIVVQGVGNLGSELVEQLLKEDVNIIVTDKIYDKIKIIQDRVNDIKIVRPQEIYDIKCDIFCSCASEKIITEEDAKKIDCKILTGSTNQILADIEIEKIFNEKVILYIPGYIVNSGDIIQLTNEIEGYSKEKSDGELADIYHNTLDLINSAEKKGELIHEIATQRAEEYVRKVAAIKMIK